MRFEPGTIAVDWEARAIRVRSAFENYWYDSRYPNLGYILLRDDTVTPDRYEIMRP